MGSDNILRNKTLHKLSIDSCDVEVSSILPVITLFPNGLHKLSITNCNFLTPITAPVIKTFQEISFIDLSGCSVTTESLLSFFTIISQSEAQPKKLVLNNLRIRSNSFTSFYEQILLIKIRRLESFSWSSNSINDENYFQFFDFLKNQINISDLCLSDSITSSNKYLINKLQNTLNNLKLERFVMRSNDEFYFKQDELIPILNQFKEQKLLKGIDLIGQRLGNEGVKALDEILSECNIIAISFDNTGSDYETLKELLNKIIENKNVEFAHWPKEDMKRVIRFAPERSNEVQMLKEKFLKKFGNNKFVAEEFDGDAEKDSIEELTSINTLRNTCNRIENSNENAEGEQSLEEILVKSVALRNENLIEEIMECVGTEFDAVETDPIVITFRKLNE
ncbi:Leucine Rich Repeat family protein [Histomonas meleagridis]|uniref:Leucine Rich Repeat family protein n=1 Tax=Histomonas meleagridis TaxID=135588 RepID=UPI00355A097E|nr:Leucine Rich Repeat family protein [Histomonas meleagridis]KAH0797494.1 Leucine Rich Repeat family protein [Histomonas meleagridis]